MSCYICKGAVLGQTYTLSNGMCRCGTPSQYPQRLGTYIGKNDEGFHVFELKIPHECSGCGNIVRWDWISCQEPEQDKELEKLFGINQPHWIGKAG